MKNTLYYNFKGPKPTKGDNKGLIILLHGYGSNELDLLDLSDILPSDYFVVSLRAPNDLSSPNSAYQGKSWCDIKISNGIKSYNTLELKQAHNLVLNTLGFLIDEYEINPSNIILFGFSQGAVMAQTVALNNPHLLKGVIALSGHHISDVVDIDQDVSGLNVFVGHGILDLQVPIQKDRETKDYLEHRGVNLDYNEYPIAHTISNEELDDVNKWISKLD